MRRRLLLLLLYISAPLLCLAQTEQTDTTRVHLKGRVVDEDGDPVSLCMVSAGVGTATTANMDGQYTLTFHTADSVVITYRMMGYEEKKRVLKKPHGRLTLNVIMRSRGKEMGEVVVSDSRRQLGTT